MPFSWQAGVRRAPCSCGSLRWSFSPCFEVVDKHGNVLVSIGRLFDFFNIQCALVWMACCNVLAILTLAYTINCATVHLIAIDVKVGRVLLPPSRSVALVEFLVAANARTAFRRLAYTRFQHVPLYLEWAPLKVGVRSISI